MDKALIARRRAAKLTQKALAKLIGVSSSTVANWEHGRQKPQPQYATRLAAILGDAEPKQPQYTNVSQRCASCDYALREGKTAIGCVYILYTKQRRGCPGGDSCTRYKPMAAPRRLQYQDFSGGDTDDD